MPVLNCVSEAADWLAGADKRSTLLSVVDRFLYLDLALGNDILLIKSQVDFTIGVVIAPDAEQLRPAPHTQAETTAPCGFGVSRHAARCASGLGASGADAGRCCWRRPGCPVKAPWLVRSSRKCLPIHTGPWGFTEPVSSAPPPPEKPLPLRTLEGSESSRSRSLRRSSDESTP